MSFHMPASPNPTSPQPPSGSLPSPNSPPSTPSVSPAGSSPVRRRNLLRGFEPRAILFDFDGVIVHSEPLHFQALQATLADEKIALTEDEYFTLLIGFDDRNAIRHLFQLRRLELTPKTQLRILANKSRRMKAIIQTGKYQALPGVSELIRALWRHYPLAICSGALRDEIEAMLEGISLRDCFPVIVAAEDVNEGKPDPEGYLKSVELLTRRLPEGSKPLTPKDCLIVEDAPSVIREVKRAGFRTLGIASTYRLPDLTDAHFAIRNLNLEQLGKALPKVKLGV